MYWKNIIDNGKILAIYVTLIKMYGVNIQLFCQILKILYNSAVLSILKKNSENLSKLSRICKNL